jgi:hypothetical protein
MAVGERRLRTCRGLVDVFQRVAGLGADINFLCSIPFSLRISANQYRLCVTTNSILPTFLLPLQAKHAAFWLSCVAPCLFLRAYCLCQIQWMDVVFLLPQRRFSTLRPSKGYCIQSPKSRDDAATMFLAPCSDRVA